MRFKRTIFFSNHPQHTNFRLILLARFITNILYLHGGESGIGLTEGGWKFPELTERCEVSLGNIRPPEVRPIPDSPNLQVLGLFSIPKISVLLLNQYRYIDTGYSTIPIYRYYRYTEISDIPEFFGISC